MRTVILKNRVIQILAFLAISLAMVLWTEMQYPQLMVIIGTVSWNR
jgi:hypothetical protein